MNAARKSNPFEGELLASGLSGSDLIHLMIDQKRKHLCQQDGFLCDEEVKISEKLADSSKIDWKNPVQNLFNGQQLILKNYVITKNTIKQDIIVDIENFLIECKVKQTLLQDICLAIEETLSNALIHAAPHISVSEIGLLQVAIDMVNLKAGFVCQDFAGKMNIDRMLKKIQKCYQDGVGNSISMTTRGAGIGKFLVFDGASSYFLFNKNGTSAFVGASYPIMADKKRLQFTKHFHIGNE